MKKSCYLSIIIAIFLSSCSVLGTGNVHSVRAGGASDGVILNWKEPGDTFYAAVEITFKPASDKLKQPIRIERGTVRTEIRGLLPEKEYEFILKAVSAFGLKASGVPIIVKTLPLPLDASAYNKNAPGDVRNLVASSNKGGIQLRWEDPIDADLKEIRITVRQGIINLPDFTVVPSGTGAAVYTDLDENAEYQFLIQAVDRGGLASRGMTAALIPQPSVYCYTSAYPYTDSTHTQPVLWKNGILKKMIYPYKSAEAGSLFAGEKTVYAALLNMEDVRGKAVAGFWQEDKGSFIFKETSAPGKQELAKASACYVPGTQLFFELGGKPVQLIPVSDAALLLKHKRSISFYRLIGLELDVKIYPECPPGLIPFVNGFVQSGDSIYCWGGILDETGLSKPAYWKDGKLYYPEIFPEASTNEITLLAIEKNKVIYAGQINKEEKTFDFIQNEKETLEISYNGKPVELKEIKLFDGQVYACGNYEGRMKRAVYVLAGLVAPGPENYFVIKMEVADGKVYTCGTSKDFDGKLHYSYTVDEKMYDLEHPVEQVVSGVGISGFVVK